MQEGKKQINQLSQAKKDELLQNLIDACVEYAGDSYEDFAKRSIDILRQAKLVEYGQSPLQEVAEQFPFLDNCLRKDELKILCQACNYDTDVLADWNKELKKYIRDGNATSSLFLQAFCNDDLLFYAQEYADWYRNSNPNKNEQTERE